MSPCLDIDAEIAGSAELRECAGSWEYVARCRRYQEVFGPDCEQGKEELWNRLSIILRYCPVASIVFAIAGKEAAISLQNFRLPHHRAPQIPLLQSYSKMKQSDMI